MSNPTLSDLQNNLKAASKKQQILLDKLDNVFAKIAKGQEGTQSGSFENKIRNEAQSNTSSLGK